MWKLNFKAQKVRPSYGTKKEYRDEEPERSSQDQSIKDAVAKALPNPDVKAALNKI